MRAWGTIRERCWNLRNGFRRTKPAASTSGGFLAQTLLVGTHEGAVRHEHLDYYLDEFTFRFNRRNSGSRGKLFYRLLQQAVQIEPHPHWQLIKPQGIVAG
jgi:hypothetical protein